ncbi:DNA repair protein RecO [Lacticaseibacillus nasuensis]|uniref:DNA repair protein RecO n=1 Tax=Lacticaseibacillus nasuensis JCM 17158 TaxID=1291734 RepID=A0A0R1JPR9_9LACO|nr:DNA repair protein RecO [Lacticaseibacillus nasuensis]KRK73279.1 Recombinational DNA repair protein (RecF pathway) [Lacticaseibacillus nasuensis JCM 17158]
MSKAVGDFGGIVLARHNYRESDMLVKLLTDRFGKKMFLLHRARKPGFRLTAGILPFTLGEYVGTVNDPGLSYLTAIKHAEQFQSIANDITLNAHATYILALIDQAFPDGEPIARWYGQAVDSLRLIDGGIDAAVVTNITEVQLLEAFGVAPNWQGCVVCGRSDLPLDFSEQYGGVLCRDHWRLDPYRFHVAPKAMYLLRQFSTIRLGAVHSITVGDATKTELRRVLDRIYLDLVGVTPKAKKFLDQLPSWQAKLPPKQ